MPGSRESEINQKPLGEADVYTTDYQAKLPEKDFIKDEHMTHDVGAERMGTHTFRTYSVLGTVEGFLEEWAWS